jgi:nucleoside-diphosphate-sugar epimerase
MTNRALITGIDSFTGAFVASALRSRGFDVFGTSRARPGSRVFALDICDRDAVQSCLRAVSPDYLINLAGVSFPARRSEELFNRVNVQGAINIAEACAELPKKPRHCIFVSSATVYSGTKSKVLINEMSPIAPMNQYGRSKANMERKLAEYSDHMPLSIVRPFNYTGPGQKEDFVVAKLVSAFKRRLKVISLGNLDVCREFFDVRDVSGWYAQLISVEKPFLANLSTGRCYSIKNVVGRLEKITGHKATIDCDKEFIRKNENKYLCGNPAVLSSLIDTGSSIPLDRTLSDMLNCKPVFL